MPYIDHRTNWTNLRKLKFYGFDPCGIKIEINYRTRGFPGGSDSKGFACNAGDPGLSPRSIRSPGGGHGNPLQYSCQENPMDRGTRQSMVHGVAQNQIQLKQLSPAQLCDLGLMTWLLWSFSPLPGESCQSEERETAGYFYSRSKSDGGLDYSGVGEDGVQRAERFCIL